jgi:hypothetical protein
MRTVSQDISAWRYFVAITKNNFKDIWPQGCTETVYIEHFIEFLALEAFDAVP